MMHTLSSADMFHLNGHNLSLNHTSETGFYIMLVETALKNISKTMSHLTHNYMANIVNFKIYLILDIHWRYMWCSYSAVCLPHWNYLKYEPKASGNIFFFTFCHIRTVPFLYIKGSLL